MSANSVLVISVSDTHAVADESGSGSAGESQYGRVLAAGVVLCMVINGFSVTRVEVCLLLSKRLDSSSSDGLCAAVSHQRSLEVESEISARAAVSCMLAL